MPILGQRIDPGTRFWAMVDMRMPNECWLWTGYKNHKGYGMFKADPAANAVMAHRFAWEYCSGRTILDQHQVLHACDNPSCVNPHHLYMGTHTDNMRDRTQRKRTARGEETGRAKLTAEQVLRVRAMYQTGWHSQLDLARKFGISRSGIGYVVRGESWKHL